MAIAVDVTFASDGPGGDDGVRGRVALGGGPGICVGIMGHPVMNRILEQAAGRLDIRTQPVITPGRTFTDTDAIHISGHGSAGSAGEPAPPVYAYSGGSVFPEGRQGLY